MSTDTTEKPTPQQVLDLELPENDANANTVRQYLAALARVAWEEKRPFGNSGWHHELFEPFVKAGFVEGKLDEHGYVEEFDRDAALTLIEQAFDALGAAPTPPPFLDFMPMSPQVTRLEGARLAVQLHSKIGINEGEDVIETADLIAAYVSGGIVPAVDEGPDVRINLLRTDDHIEVWVNGDLAASTDYDQAGHAGMDAVENAVVRIANAAGIELGQGGGK